MPILNNKYELEFNSDYRLGEGSFGVVYKARDTVLKLDVALKISKAERADKTQYSLISEVSRMIELSNINLVRYYDGFVFGGTNDLGEETERQVAVMELIEGPSLKEAILNSIQYEEEILDISIGVLEGLKYLHTNGVKKIIHRDLKPSNILLVKKNDRWIPKITDFGISKEVQKESSVNLSGVVGTLAYMAPEQFGAKNKSGKLDKDKSKIYYPLDLWAFGVVLYEILTRELPFGSDQTHTEGEIIYNIINSPVPSRINDIPDPYQSIVKTCLQRDTSRRYKTAMDIIQELEDRKAHTVGGKTILFDFGEEIGDSNQKTGQEEEKLWQKILRINSTGGFEEYIKNYPAGIYALEAKEKLNGFDEEIWERAKTVDSKESYQAYINAYPIGNHSVKAKKRIKEFEKHEAIENRNNVDKNTWEVTQKNNTLEAYWNYLELYPAGLFINEAKNRINEIETRFWEQSVTKNRKEAFQDYLKRFPSGNFSSKAKQRIKQIEETETLKRIKQEEKVLWNKATKQNTIHAYRTYIKNSKHGLYKEQAIKLLMAFDIATWGMSWKSETKRRYIKYLELFPQGLFHRKAKEKIKEIEDLEQQEKDTREDELMWKKTEDKGTLDAYSVYVSDSKHGFFKKEAIKKIEDFDKADWEMALKSQTKNTFIKYLENFPNGIYYREAKAWIRSIEKKEQLEKDQQEDELLWEKTQKDNSLDAYNTYIRDSKHHFFKKEALKKYGEYAYTAWKTALISQTKDTFIKYLEDFPMGLHSIEAKENISKIEEKEEQEELQRKDHTKWEEVKQHITIQSCRNYLKEFPEGSFVYEASTKIQTIWATRIFIAGGIIALIMIGWVSYQAWTEKIENKEYALIIGDGTKAEGYFTYIAKYPNGKFRDQAEQHLIELYKKMISDGQKLESKEYVSDYKKQFNSRIVRNFLVAIQEYDKAAQLGKKIQKIRKISPVFSSNLALTNISRLKNRILTIRKACDENIGYMKRNQIPGYEYYETIKSIIDNDSIFIRIRSNY